MDDFTTLQSNITSSLVSTTRTTGQLANSDLPFHRSLDSSLASNLDRQNARLLALAQRLLGSATAHAETVRPAPRLSDIEAVDGNWRQVVDVVDSLLERADTALDEFTGAVRRLSPGAEVSKANGSAARQGGSRVAAGLRAQEIEKPQLLFEHPPQNDETGEFLPLLQSKPHAKVPLAERKAGEHPYRREIEEFAFPASVYSEAEPTPYQPFESTTATFVDTEEAMYEMLSELEQATEIAIDLEHHDQRSYIGIVSLMQISTRDKDWIVDTLKPWRRKLSALNSVFANPAILKVLHGAYMDVVWLQRDLGLYLVGLFDTHYASKALSYSGGSLAFLLKKFANVDAQKQYQMADWRVRPLPPELFDYARSDTHYLLYIFDNMRNELIQKSDFSIPDQEGDKINDVLLKSSETALQTYEHPRYDTELGQGPVGWYKLLARTTVLLSKEQFAVFRAVHKWRDDVAREQDDSPHYVLQNHTLFSIAKAMPMSRADLLNTAHTPTQTLRLRADEVLAVIRKAKEDGADGPDMLETLAKVEPRYPRKEKQQISHSVAAFLPQNQPTPVANASAVAPVPAPSILPIRSTLSALWGRTFGSSEQRRAVGSVPDVHLSVPLPPLTAEVFADGEDIVDSSPVEDAEPVQTQEAEPQEQEDDVFVLKQLGKKRKRGTDLPLANGSTGLDGMAANSDEVALSPDEATERAQAKAERKKAKKEAKRAARLAARDGEADVGSEAQDEEPFDYSSAPSMLNPPRESREEMRARRKKEINPYAKSLDAPKGLPRVQKERAGRSMTFRS